jgi:hypothetical protein
MMHSSGSNKRLAVLAGFLALAGFGWARSDAADEAGASRVPAPVIHAPEDNRVTVNVDEYSRGDDSLAITEAVAEAKRKRAGRLVFAKRVYRIAGPKATEAGGHIVLDGLADLTIDGNGCTLVFEAMKTGVFVKDCNRLLVRNLNVDWSRLLASAGVVEEKKERRYVRINSKHDRAKACTTIVFFFGGSVHARIFVAPAAA